MNPKVTAFCLGAGLVAALFGLVIIPSCGKPYGPRYGNPGPGPFDIPQQPAISSPAMWAEPSEAFTPIDQTVDIYTDFGEQPLLRRVVFRYDDKTEADVPSQHYSYRYAGLAIYGRQRFLRLAEAPKVKTATQHLGGPIVDADTGAVLPRPLVVYVNVNRILYMKQSEEIAKPVK